MSAKKYKAGDRVVVRSLSWYNVNKNGCGDVRVPCCFVSGMAAFCGVSVTIVCVNKNAWNASYHIKEDGGRYCWSDEMFEGLAGETYVFLKTKDVKDLPKTFDECAKIVGRDKGEIWVARDVREAKAENLRICRDAYWWLADDWKPDWKKNTKKHCVVIRDGRVGVATAISKLRMFAFPTPEMADAFGKNFKKELEACKEVFSEYDK